MKEDSFKKMGLAIGQKVWIKNFSIYELDQKTRKGYNKSVFISALSEIYNELKLHNKGKFFFEGENIKGSNLSAPKVN